MRLQHLRPTLVVAATTLAACSAGASNDPALGSRLRVAGAQFVRGAAPSSEDGPGVASVDLKTTTVWPGYADKPISAALETTATAAALALSGDEGYWIALAGPPDFSTPTLPSVHASTSFNTRLAPGAYTLEIRAIDGAGRFGAAARTTLTVVANPPSISSPEGPLVVTLTWDTESDLDLHFADPSGSEVFHAKETTLDTFSPGSRSDGGGYAYLDVDSNGSCIIDGRRRERVTWVGTPPSGRYAVRVDAASLCGEPIAHFQVQALLDGATLGAASGVLVETDTWGPHDRGAGRLAFTFDLP